jgi:hypothetical protein
MIYHTVKGFEINRNFSEGCGGDSARSGKFETSKRVPGFNQAKSQRDSKRECLPDWLLLEYALRNQLSAPSEELSGMARREVKNGFLADEHSVVRHKVKRRLSGSGISCLADATR